MVEEREQMLLILVGYTEIMKLPAYLTELYFLNPSSINAILKDFTTK